MNMLRIVALLIFVGIFIPIRVAFDAIPLQPDLEYFSRLHHIQQMNYLIYKDLDRLREEYPGTRVAESLKYRVRWMILKDYFADEQILCIRGTNNLLNAWIDAQYFLKLEPEIGVKVHRGFNKAVKEIIPSIKSLLDPDRKIILSGHSMGGSMAIILAMYLETAGYDIQWIVTMGQPKVTDKIGIQTFEHLPVLRLVYQKDLIPILPPPFVSRYKHFGAHLNLYDTGFKYERKSNTYPLHEDNSAESLKLWNDIRSNAKKAPTPQFQLLYDIDNEIENVSDGLKQSWFFGLRHAMEVYRQKVQQIIRSWDGSLPGYVSNEK